MMGTVWWYVSTALHHPIFFSVQNPMIHPFPGAVPLSESRNFRNPGDPVFLFWIYGTGNLERKPIIFWVVTGVMSKQGCIYKCTSCISFGKLTYPFPKALLKMMFFFPRWDMSVPRRVQTYAFSQSLFGHSQWRANQQPVGDWRQPVFPKRNGSAAQM